MTNTPDELERVEPEAVEYLRLRLADESGYINTPDIEAIHEILSQRAELLATVERQGEALKLAREIFADMIRYGKVFSGEGPAPYGSYYIGEGALEILMRDEARAALTGEDK